MKETIHEYPVSHEYKICLCDNTIDEIIIQNNVQKSLQDETDKANRELDYTRQIEDSLADDPNVVDEPSLESAMKKYSPIGPIVYQPSLFEGIMLKLSKNINENENTNIIMEAIREYTKLNLIKALKLESFDLNTIKKLANNYAYK